MKRSEFREKVRNVLRVAPPTCRNDPDYCAGAALELAERAGVQFDPEEPELPGRLSPVGNGLAVQQGQCLGKDAWQELYREVARRYNAVGRIADMFGPNKAVAYRNDHPAQAASDVVEQVMAVLEEEGVTR